MQFIEVIHQRLLAWGDWVVRKENSGLGYALSCYDKVQGGNAGNGSTCDGLEFEILETEAIVQTLPKESRLMVIAFYTRKSTAEAVAKGFGVSKDTLERRIGRAHRMIRSAVEVRAALRAVKRQQIPLAPLAAKAV